jgi:hypothetical protein
MSTSNAFVCERCGYETTAKGNLVRHLQAKKTCRATVSDVNRDEQLKRVLHRDRPTKLHECHFCGVKYNHMSSLSKHKKVCKKKDAKPNSQSQNIEPLPNEVISHKDGSSQPTNVLLEPHHSKNIQDVNSEEYTRLQNIFNNMFQGEIVSLKNEIKELKLQLASTSSSTTNNNTTNNNTNTTNNNQRVNIININNFGNEDISHITPDFLSHCILNPTKGIASLIENIHYDPNKKCNNNIRHKSSKQSTVEKWVHPQWVLCDASSTIDDLISKGYKMMSLHHQETFLNDPDIQEDDVKRQQYEYFRFLTDKNDYKYYKVKREIHCMIKNHTMNQVDNAQPQVEASTVPTTSQEISSDDIELVNEDEIPTFDISQEGDDVQTDDI